MSSSALNTSARYKIVALPDQFNTGGEYSPDPTFAGLLNAMGAIFRGGNVGIVGRDKSQPAVRVLSITYDANTMTGLVQADANIPALAIGEFVKFNRVMGDNKQPITGSYAVSAVGGIGAFTIRGYSAGNASRPSGTVRRDVLAYGTVDGFAPEYTTLRKIGAPLKKFRGRRSKRRSA
jgi:hypothetical protein